MSDALLGGERYLQIPGHQFGSVTSRRAAERCALGAPSIRGAIFQDLRDVGAGHS